MILEGLIVGAVLGVLTAKTQIAFMNYRRRTATRRHYETMRQRLVERKKRAAERLGGPVVYYAQPDWFVGPTGLADTGE